MVRRPPDGFEHLDHILCTGRLCLSDDAVHLQFHPKPSHSGPNVGRLLVSDDRSLAAFVGALPGSEVGSFRSHVNIVTRDVEPSSGPADENHMGFLRCQTCANRLASICRSGDGIAVPFAGQVNAA